MILRHLSPAFLFFLLSCYVPTIAAEDFNCLIEIGKTKFNLTSLNAEQTASRTRITPPTTMLDTVLFNLCDSLKTQDVAEGDQCPSGTRACLTKSNQKQKEDERVVQVIPVAQGDYLDATFSQLYSPHGVSILMHGPPYPDNSVDSNKQSDPKFLSYNGSLAEVEWTHPAACGSQQAEKPPGNDEGSGGDNEEKESRGSGIGWFFLVLLLAFLAYFGLGAYHKYTTYGATGMDLIPHKDFWQEVPYMLSDVASHLCSSVRPRRSSNRGGYIAV
ncbi:hypothetical protein BT96DRAFT_961350 [Gymnopus androsaceus JB14]|uniref:Uncharacterized protein n=1 Tax=Gymnopus androsaceus JB14 TaxID=1447944 RepID=A0A6A4IGH6_9AGAR|nr:hypothetical protein BT96DRAFT_961350 [Gymnopus androsaceus JB14]